MAATTDHAQKTVLMLATVRDRSVKLLELPAFSERGVLPEVSCHMAAPAPLLRPIAAEGAVWACCASQQV